MSFGAVGAALETAAMAITPAIDTVFESGEFTLASGSPYAGAYKAVDGRPYQRLQLLPARPHNNEISANWGEQGDFQFSLFYPLRQGAKPARDRVALIRAVFRRGESFVSGGVTTTIQTTPAVVHIPDDNRYVLHVWARYFAPVYTA